MLGGSSAINGMVYVRGERRDYDDWVKAGAHGWSFDEVLPFFLKSERFERADHSSHGATGPLDVSSGRTYHPLADAFIEACAQKGLPRNLDYCAGSQLGAFATFSTTGGGQRSSTAKAFLQPARHRKNLRIITDCVVDKVLLRNGCAVGARILTGGKSQDLYCNAEVIVSAGTIGSPAILLRSGIGPADELRQLGVTVHQDLPGVGRNVQEHATIPISKLVDQPTYNSPFGPLAIARNLMSYLIHRRGPMTSPAVHAMAYAKSCPELAFPDLALNFLPLAISFAGNKPAMHPKPGITIAANVLRPLSRGRIFLRSTDPTTPPGIAHQLFGNPADLDILVSGCKLIASIYAAPALGQHVIGDNTPSPLPTTDEDWRQYILQHGAIGYHPTSSCAMGDGPDAVTDAQLRVHGLQNLRVVDASVMPNIISGNTNAPTIMIAEKAAHILRSG